MQGIPARSLIPKRHDTSNLIEAFRSLHEDAAASKASDCGRLIGGNLFPYRCMSRYCPNCKRAKGKKAFRLIEDKIDWSEHHHFATLVFRDVLEITPTDIEELRQVVSKLRRRAAFKRINGCYGVLEVSHDAEEALPYHLHVHLLLEGDIKVPGKTTTEALKEVWVDLGGLPDVRVDYLPQLHALKTKTPYMNKGLKPTMPAEAQTKIIAAFGGTCSAFKWGGWRESSGKKIRFEIRDSKATGQAAPVTGKPGSSASSVPTQVNEPRSARPGVDQAQDDQDHSRGEDPARGYSDEIEDGAVQIISPPGLSETSRQALKRALRTLAELERISLRIKRLRRRRSSPPGERDCRPSRRLWGPFAGLSGAIASPLGVGAKGAQMALKWSWRSVPLSPCEEDLPRGLGGLL